MTTRTAILTLDRRAALEFGNCVVIAKLGEPFEDQAHDFDDPDSLPVDLLDDWAALMEEREEGLRNRADDDAQTSHDYALAVGRVG